MDKLELKHIAPYLPYGLKIKILNHKCDYVGIEYSEANGFYFIGDSLHVTYNGGSTGKDIRSFKPILRPLSDLNKAKLFDNYGDEKLTAIEEFEGNWDLGALDWVLLEVSKGNQIERLFELSYNVIERLIEYHFDIFELIDAGLAIDINTLKNEK